MHKQNMGLRPSAWYTTQEMATILRVHVSSLQRWHTAQPPTGPSFFEFSKRVVRYRRADVIAYVNSKHVDQPAA